MEMQNVRAFGPTGASLQSANRAKRQRTLQFCKPNLQSSPSRSIQQKMDSINSSNLLSLSSCDLNAKFNDRSYADWSQTNLISFVTLDGIYIIQPRLERSHGQFNIELIRNPTNKFKHLPFEESNITFDDFVHKLNNEHYIELSTDPALATVQNQTITSAASTIKSSSTLPNETTWFRHFRLAKWSPIIDTYPRQCLLLAITVDYQLLIYSQKNESWNVQDLSKEYDKIWCHTGLARDLKKANYETVRQNLHSLSFCNACWRPSNHHDCPLLVAATITGDLVVWQVNFRKSTPPITNNIQESSNHFHDVTFSVSAILKTKQEYISSMQLYDSLLIASSRDGQVALYDLTLNFEAPQEPSTGRTHQPNGTNSEPNNPKTIALQDIPATAILWHYDWIEVTDFYIQRLSSDTFRVVLAKSTNICWCIVHYLKKTDNEPATLAISDSFSAIDGLDPEVALHQTPATWLRPAGNRRAVLVADDGSFYQLEFFDDRQDSSPSFSAIRTGKEDLTDMLPRGLCTSPNGHLITMISTVTFMYDSYKLSTPTKLILLPTVNERKFFTESVQNLLDESWLATNNINSPMDACDSMDYILSIYSQLDNRELNRLYENFKEALINASHPKTKQQYVLLKIVGFLIMKLAEQKSFRLLGDDQSIDLEQAVYDWILMHEIDKTIGMVLSKGSTGDHHGTLTNVQVNSLRNYMQWLLGCTEGGPIGQVYRDRFESLISSKYKKVPHEMCPVCQEAVNFKSIRLGFCKNQHRFFRCSRSLLILDPKDDELECKHCGRHYMTSLLWPTDNLWLCLFCQ